MNYCIYIRKRKGKPFCKYFNKETTWEDCKECKEKIYKTKKRNNSVYKKNAQYFKNTVQSKAQQYSKIQNNVQKIKKFFKLKTRRGNMKKKYFEKQRLKISKSAGITLISLVVTVIVLLILARNINNNAKWK